MSTTQSQPEFYKVDTTCTCNATYFKENADKTTKYNIVGNDKSIYLLEHEGMYSYGGEFVRVVDNYEPTYITDGAVKVDKLGVVFHEGEEEPYEHIIQNDARTVLKVNRTDNLSELGIGDFIYVDCDDNNNRRKCLYRIIEKPKSDDTVMVSSVNQNYNLELSKLHPPFKISTKTWKKIGRLEGIYMNFKNLFNHKVKAGRIPKRQRKTRRVNNKKRKTLQKNNIKRKRSNPTRKY